METREDAAKDSAIGAVMGGARIEDAIVAGMNPQHVIVTGSGAAPTDSVGYPWNARYTIASGNLLGRLPLQRHCGVARAPAGQPALPAD